MKSIFMYIWLEHIYAYKMKISHFIIQVQQRHEPAAGLIALGGASIITECL